MATLYPPLSELSAGKHDLQVSLLGIAQVVAPAIRRANGDDVTEKYSMKTIATDVIHQRKKHWDWYMALGIAFIVAGVPASGNAQTATLALLARATNPNPTLNSYTATAQLSATLHAVVSIHKSYNGTVYYLRPNRKIEFQGVAGPLSRFKDLASTTPTYEQATQQYDITPLTDNGTVSTYSLVPKKTGGRLKNIVVAVGDKSAMLGTTVWNYTNGGKLTVGQTYATVGTYRLPSEATISARFPGYSADGTLTFANYQPNATVSPSVFATPQ